MKFLGRLCALALCMLMLLSVLPTAAAYGRIDPNTPVSLTVSYKFGDVPVQIYRVASVSETARFQLTGDFAGYTELQTYVEEGDWDRLSWNLETRIAADRIKPLKTGKTGQDGTIVFDGLQQGMYLVTADACTVGDTSYFPMTFLISLPNLDEATDQWIYKVQAKAKDTTITDDGKDISVKVQKIWKDNEDQAKKRPQSIQVQLYCDNRAYGKPVTLNKSNNWSKTWNNLPEGHKWTVAEVGIPTGYEKPQYDRVDNQFYVINTYGETPPPVQPPKPSLPQTGQLWWPVPLLALGGMVLFLIGWIQRRKAEME